MIKKIDIFDFAKSRHQVLHYFTRQLYFALKRSHIHCHLLPSPTTNNLPRIVNLLIRDTPDCTFSFNGLLPDRNGKFLSDELQIPHIAFLVDPPHQFFPLLKSSYTIITCIDRSFRDNIRQFPFPNVLFLPHAAAEESLRENMFHPREYAVVMIASCIDYLKIHKKWEKQHPPLLLRALNETAEIALSDISTTFLQAFFYVINQPDIQKQLNLNEINYVELFDDLEDYIRGKDRVEMLRAIRDVPVQVFGPKNSRDGWGKYFTKKDSHIHLMGNVSFGDALKIFQKSKIALNSMPNYKYGAHERIFTAIASGALPITNENVYMRENFQDDQNIALFPPKRWDIVNQKIHTYLEDESKRLEVVTRGRNIVLAHHTWDQRILQLQEEIPPLFENIRGF